MAKLPAMLLASRAKTTPENAKGSHIVQKQQSRVSKTNNTSRTVKKVSNNQETHEPNQQQKARSHAKTKKKTTPLTTVDQVNQRKKMYAKWKKASEIAEPPENRNPPTKLPIVPSSPKIVATGPLKALVHSSEIVYLPPIDPHSSTQPLVVAVDEEAIAQPETPTYLDEDSVDEDEINDFLSWTEKLTCPDEEFADIFDSIH